MATTVEQSLTEALAIIGVEHRPSKIVGKRDWFNGAGEHIGTYDAHEGWQKLREITAAAEPLRAA